MANLLSYVYELPKGVQEEALDQVRLHLIHLEGLKGEELEKMVERAKSLRLIEIENIVEVDDLL